MNFSVVVNFLSGGPRLTERRVRFIPGILLGTVNRLRRIYYTILKLNHCSSERGTLGFFPGLAGTSGGDESLCVKAGG